MIIARAIKAVASHATVWYWGVVYIILYVGCAIMFLETRERLWDILSFIFGIPAYYAIFSGMYDMWSKYKQIRKNRKNK